MFYLVRAISMKIHITIFNIFFQGPSESGKPHAPHVRSSQGGPVPKPHAVLHRLGHPVAANHGRAPAAASTAATASQLGPRGPRRSRRRAEGSAEEAPQLSVRDVHQRHDQLLVRGWGGHAGHRGHSEADEGGPEGREGARQAEEAQLTKPPTTKTNLGKIHENNFCS